MPQNAEDNGPPDRAVIFERIAAVLAYRARLEDRLAAGALTLEELLDEADRDPILHGTKILGLLEALPHTGKVTTRRALAAAGVDEAAQIAHLSAEQRARLTQEIAALGEPTT